MDRLEDRRGPKLGDIALQLPSHLTRDLLTASFHRHAQQAAWHTQQELLRLAGQAADGAGGAVTAAVEWWRTIESLTAALYAVARIESDNGLRPERPRITQKSDPAFATKWSCVASWFSEGRPNTPKDLTKRLDELRAFRNSAEHSSRQQEIAVKHSRLGTIPGYANLSDAMEAMAICIEASSFMRDAFPGLDMMPVVGIPSEVHEFYWDLDEVARDLFFPQYERVVQNLGLTSDVALYPAPPKLQGSAIAIPKILAKTAGDEFDLEPVEPIDVFAENERYAREHPNCPDTGTYKLPGYGR